MKIDLLLLGKTKENYLEKGIQDFLGRLNHYVKASITVLKDKTKSQWNDEQVKQHEGALLLKNVPPGAYTIALDPRGKQYSSEEFAALLTTLEMRGTKSISLLIGGPLGLSREVTDGADMCLSLSKMTFTHDMTRMVLLEQLYRAYTIKKGEKYHK